MNQEIEEGELSSDLDDANQINSKNKQNIELNKDEQNELNKLFKKKSGQLESGAESGELTDSEELKDNPYEEEDEFMLELKMNALKSILEKNSKNEENPDESNLTKSKKIKLKNKNSKLKEQTYNDDDDVQVIFDKRELGVKRKLSSKAKKKFIKRLEKLGGNKRQNKEKNEPYEYQENGAQDDDIIEITSKKFYEKKSELKIDTYNDNNNRYLIDNYNLESMDIEPLDEPTYNNNNNNNNNNFNYSSGPSTSSYAYQSNYQNYQDKFSDQQNYEAFDQYNTGASNFYGEQQQYNYTDNTNSINFMANFLSQFNNVNQTSNIINLATQLMQTALLMPQQQMNMPTQKQISGQHMKSYNKSKNSKISTSGAGLLPTPSPSPLLKLKLTPPPQLSPNNNFNQRPNFKNTLPNKVSPVTQAKQHKQGVAIQNKKPIFSPNNSNVTKNNIQVKVTNSPQKLAQNNKSPLEYNQTKHKQQQYNNKKFKNDNSNIETFTSNNEKPKSPKVIFTLSSPSTVSLTSPASSAKTISPISDTNKECNIVEFGFGSNGIDVDERFIDKTTSNLDVDYRQLEVKSPSDDKKLEIEKEKEEEDKTVDDDEILKLRMKLIDTLNKKKKMQEEQQKQEEKVQEKKLEQDMTILKQKLMKDEEDLIKTNQKQFISTSSIKQIESNNNINNKKPALNQSMSFVNLNKPKISPIIIHLNSNDKDDDDDDDDDQDENHSDFKNKTSPKHSLKSNIDLFLKEAKELASNSSQSIEIKKAQTSNDNSFNQRNDTLLKKSIGDTQHSNSNILDSKQLSRSTSLVKHNSDVEKMIQKAELEKKDIIKSLRDKIISKNITISDLTMKSLDFKQVKIKKEKDIELTRQKIAMLREQLSAAEKILSVNEEKLNSLKVHERNNDLRLVKLQNMKKVQQQLLQKILASPSFSSGSFNTNSNELPKSMSLTINETSELIKQNSSSLSSIEDYQQEKGSSSHVFEKSVVSPINDENINNKSIEVSAQPPLPKNSPPPLPKSPPPLPPSPPSCEPPRETEFKLDDASKQTKSYQDESIKFANIKLPSQMTLGGMIAAAASIKNHNNNSNASSKEKSASNSILSSLTRPNLYTSEQTNSKLEEMAKYSISINPNNELTEFKKLNENVVINAKVVNISKSNSNNPTQKTNNQSSASNTKKLNSQHEQENKKIDLKNRQELSECLEDIMRDYPSVRCDSFDIWCYESIIPVSQKEVKQINLKSNEITETPVGKTQNKNYNVVTSQNYNVFNPKEEEKGQISLSIDNKNKTCDDIYIIDDITQYESPLKVFRGYRFSSHFAEFNQFEDAYSKLYCNAIDFRKPFCPYDLHGSCKDSNCVYQHSNVMTLDNFQRTEHFLSYCPKLLDLSENPTQKEAIKKLKNYAKTFMNNNLNRMSIKDYFKFLYDHIVSNLNLEPSFTTIFSRIPVLCLNNNKSLGAYDHLNEFEMETESNSQLQLFVESKNSNLTDLTNDPLLNLLDQALTPNLNRTLEAKLKLALVNNQLDINWLKKQQDELKQTEKTYLNQNEIIIAWLYYARQSYTISLNNPSLTNSTQIEKLLNVLCHSLESNPKCELLWLIYLKSYLTKRYSINDYHEICMLCMDNLITYDLVWFILNTVSIEFVELLFDRYEKFLLNMNSESLVNEFEQIDFDEEQMDTGVQDHNADTRVSFYLCELIFYKTYLKMATSNKNIENRKENSEDSEDIAKTLGKNIFISYLRSNEFVAKLEPNDLSILWLSYIHLEAFNYLPNFLRISSLLTSRISRYIDDRLFWHMEAKHSNSNKLPIKKRNFNQLFFESLSLIYNLRASSISEYDLTRRFDLFLLPWSSKFNQSSNNQSKLHLKAQPKLEELQNLFHESLKSLSNRCMSVSGALNSNNSSFTKQKMRQFTLPLLINFINLECSNKRFDVASKLCERLLKSSDTEMLKELWLSLVYIQRCQQQANSNFDSAILENTINTCLKMFPLDSQIRFVSCKYYASINQTNKSIELIESFIRVYYANTSNITASLEPNILFEHFLGIREKKLGFEFQNSDSKEMNAIYKELDAVYEQKRSKTSLNEFVFHKLNFSILYCFYMSLKGLDHFKYNQICTTYEKLINNFKLVNYRSILWIRYFKYISSNENPSQKEEDSEVYTNHTLKLISKSVLSLNEVSTTKNNLIIPFNYLPKLDEHSSLFNHNEYYYNNNNLNMNCLLSSCYYYNSDLNDFNDEEIDTIDKIKAKKEINNPSSTKNEKITIEIDYYYHNCLVDVLLKLFGKSLNDKYLLTKYIISLMPENLELIKMLVSFSTRLNGIQKTLQILYDHLSVHSINDEHLWILCIKLCLEVNDLQQAIMIYHKAEIICMRHKRSIIELKKLATFLFPQLQPKSHLYESTSSKK